MDHTTTLAGGAPILALDMYEHSYHMDYGARAAAYVDAFTLQSLALGATTRMQIGQERFFGYVACTRAREHLLLTGVMPTSEYLADLNS